MSLAPQLLMFGADRRTMGIDERERVSRAVDAIRHRLCEWRSFVAEGLVISTCHRVEIYLATADADLAGVSIGDVVFDRGTVWPLADLQGWVRRQDVDAAVHLARVASGLTSAVLGEHEIAGQVRRAATEAHRLGTAGPLLAPVIYAALAASRRVRSETSLGRGTASVAGAAVKWLIAEGCVKDAKLLILGSGVVARDVARRVAAHSIPVRTTVIASRSLEHAGRLASEVPGASVIHWSDVKSALYTADVIVGAFQSSDGALTASDLRADGTRSRWIADLSMPRAFDPAAAALPGVQLRNVDDFTGDAARMRRVREQAVPAAEAIARHEAALGFVRFSQRANRRAVERVA